VRLSIVGDLADQRYFRYCRQLSEKLNVADRVTWVGPLPFDQLWTLMRYCRAVLLSSRVEAFPNVMLEAAACNPDRPLVALRFPWSAEFDEFFDARCRPGRLPTLLDRLGRSSADVVVHRRRQAIDRYSWQRTVSVTAEALLRLNALSPPTDGEQRHPNVGWTGP
jgi:glycosyltransferase involved in cell wall biosynthesis